MAMKATMEPGPAEGGAVEAVALAMEQGINPQWFLPSLDGMRYYEVLAHLHRTLKPASYLEIGIRKGRSFMLADCPSIGIDPLFKIERDVIGKKNVAHLAQITSDGFFAQQNPCQILGVFHIDMFFLDGMHLSEYLLRDFINSEKYAVPESLIILHDCLPLDVPMTRRGKEDTRYPAVHNEALWTGDVWRVVPILKRYRPDLAIACLDAAPTGLVMITSLDPSSKVLAQNYDRIVEEMHGMNLGEIGLRNYAASLPVLATAEFLDPGKLAARFAFRGQDTKVR